MSSQPQEPQASQLQEKEEEIHHLQDKVEALTAQLAAALQAGGGDRSAAKRRQHPLSPHTMNVREVRMAASNKRTIHAQRERLGRNASITTQQILETLATKPESQQAPSPVQRIMDMFQHPAHYMDYLGSELFAKDLLKLACKIRYALEREPRVLFIQSPVYVLGDIHGNVEDLHFFSDNIWRLGMSLTAGNFLFLGDYVDRGLNCLECVAYLLAMKYQLPNKVFLLRGNHETRDVNGWEEHYGERSFIYQCRTRFGDDLGYRVWEGCNQVFDRLPLAAVIDQDIFCVHGGIPRPVGANTTRIQDILAVPRVAGINPPYEHEQDLYQQVASDCIWSDPASEYQEMTSVDPVTGYGQSLRGGGAICFGNKAVTDFLKQHELSFIMRAHEAHAEGVAISKGARVFTVFSTSQDHNQGAQAMAGCLLVDNDRIQVINRSPAYKNQYVHRRDSVSVSSLPAEELQKRMKLGLVTPVPAADETGHESSEEETEEWMDFEDLSVKEQDTVASNSSKGDYVIDARRRSSIDLNSLNDTFRNDLQTSDAYGNESSGSLAEAEPDTKRFRSKRPSVASIQETGENQSESDVDTVDGNEDVELHDA